MPLRVLHVITGLWKHTGGPAEVIPALCAAMVDAGARVTLATLEGDTAPAVDAAAAHGVRVCKFAPFFRHTIWYSRDLHVRIDDLVGEHDIVHIHGIWQFPDWAAAAAARRAGVPCMISPHGLLQPARLRKSWWKKWASAIVADRSMINQSDCLHVTSADEVSAVRRFGYRGPVAMIPNGITQPGDIAPARGAALAAAFRKDFPDTAGKRLLLFLSRIEPIKGITMLAQVWSQRFREFPDWHLVIAGPEERSHCRDVMSILHASGALERTTLTGPLFDDRKSSAYLAADVFVLPTISENFGLVIGEALSYGKPVITTTGAPWPGIEEHGCGWWVDPTYESIDRAVVAAMSLPAQTLTAMGGRGASWVAEAFTWEAESDRLREVYDWLLGRSGNPPASVALATGSPARME